MASNAAGSGGNRARVGQRRGAVEYPNAGGVTVDRAASFIGDRIDRAARVEFDLSAGADRSASFIGDSAARVEYDPHR